MHFKNYFIKIKNAKIYYSDRTILIICVNNIKNLPRSRIIKVLLNLSISANAFALSTPILLFSKIRTKCKNNRLIIVIINKNRNFVLDNKNNSPNK